MASFECAGSIVLSYKPQKEQKGRPDERKTFNNAKLGTVKKLLAEVALMTADRVKFFSAR